MPLVGCSLSLDNSQELRFLHCGAPVIETPLELPPHNFVLISVNFKARRRAATRLLPGTSSLISSPLHSRAHSHTFTLTASRQVHGIPFYLITISPPGEVGGTDASFVPSGPMYFVLKTTSSKARAVHSVMSHGSFPWLPSPK